MNKKISEYIPHIDGVRAVAVLAVILYHLCPILCPGGYTGVDVFFVISGYLITGNIMKRLKEGNFTFSDFYHRRILRIMPAYFGVIVFTLAVAAAIFPYDRFMLTGESAFASAFYTVNFYFLKFTNGYFDSGAETNPLLNLWSLSVEQQFYIIIPLMMVFIFKWKPTFMVTCLTILAAASFLLAEASILGFFNLPGLLNLLTSQQGAFYMLPDRAWELLGGGLLAFIPASNEHGRKQAFASLVGFASVLVPYIFYSEGTPFPGLAALPSLLGSVLLIRYGHAGVIAYILESKLFTSVGRISYSLYLYHWPVFVFWRYYRGNELNLADYFGMVIISFSLAAISFFTLESPMRKMRWLTAKISIPSAFIVSTLIMYVCWNIIWTYGCRDTFHTQANSIRASEFWVGQETRATYLKHDFPTSCTIDKYSLTSPHITHFDFALKRSTEPLFNLGIEDGTPCFIMIGDSHAMALAPGIDKVSRELGLTGVFIRSSMFPLWDTYTDAANCQWNKKKANDLLSWLKRHPELKTVVITCMWYGRMQQQYTNWDGEVIEDPNLQKASENLAKTCQKLTDLGCKVLLTGPEPLLPVNPAKLARESAIKRNAITLPTITQNESDHQMAQINEVLKGQIREGVFIIPLSNAFFKHGVFTYQYEGKFLYRDQDHLTPEGAIIAMKYALPCFRKAMEEPVKNNKNHTYIPEQE